MLLVRPNLMPLLKEKGITQMELSKMSGVPQGSISRFDKNFRHDDDHVFSIAESLGVTMDKLFVKVEHKG